MTYLMVGLLVLSAIAAVAYPLLNKPAVDPARLDDATLEQLIASYRAALNAGSVCGRCLRDNPAGANYCLECGLGFASKNDGEKTVRRR